jgi:L-seryl-tRNA(Ser) seleniumtransferase
MGEATEEIPVWRMISATEADIHDRAERARLWLARSGVDSTMVAVRSTVGGGSLPDQDLPSWALALPGPAEPLAGRLRLGGPAVFGRIVRDQVLLDLRTILPEDDSDLLEAVRRASGDAVPAD